LRACPASFGASFSLWSFFIRILRSLGISLLMHCWYGVNFRDFPRAGFLRVAIALLSFRKLHQVLDAILFLSSVTFHFDGLFACAFDFSCTLCVDFLLVFVGFHLDGFSLFCFACFCCFLFLHR